MNTNGLSPSKPHTLSHDWSPTRKQTRTSEWYIPYTTVNRTSSENHNFSIHHFLLVAMSPTT